MYGRQNYPKCKTNFAIKKIALAVFITMKTGLDCPKDKTTQNNDTNIAKKSSFASFIEMKTGLD